MADDPALSARFTVRATSAEARRFGAAATVAGDSISVAMRRAMAAYADAVTEDLRDSRRGGEPGAVEVPTDEYEGRPEHAAG
jgi:hypothetical protein